MNTPSARNLRYTQAIVNSGREAGASLEHPHGQLLGMSFVPRELAEEQARFARFAGSCLLCTTVDAEEGVGHRVIYADDRVVSSARSGVRSPTRCSSSPARTARSCTTAPPRTWCRSGDRSAPASTSSATGSATWPTTSSSTLPPTA